MLSSNGESYNESFCLAEIHKAATTADRIARVPIAAVNNWADRAALALTHAQEPSVAIVSLCEQARSSRHHRHWRVLHAGASMHRGNVLAADADQAAALTQLVCDATARMIDDGDVEAFPHVNLGGPEHATRVESQASREAGPATIAPSRRARANPMLRAPEPRPPEEHVLEQGVRCGGRLALVVQRRRALEWSGIDAIHLRIASMQLARTVQAIFGVSLNSPWLTARETEVLDLLGTGHTEQEIAQRLHRSRFTVHDHVKNLYRKLYVANRAELVRLAVGAGVNRSPAVREIA
jgi:DNA-binding CsgD family transcriptional regulator